MSSAAEILGIDPEETTWKDFAICRGQPTELFFTEYENEQTALIVDAMCLSCPVMRECARAGVENSEIGVWGGVFLNSGKVDVNKNKHKTPDIWKRIRERLTEVQDD